jgi:hypothetical protein
LFTININYRDFQDFMTLAFFYWGVLFTLVGVPFIVGYVTHLFMDENEPAKKESVYPINKSKRKSK